MSTYRSHSTSTSTPTTSPPLCDPTITSCMEPGPVGPEPESWSEAGSETPVLDEILASYPESLATSSPHVTGGAVDSGGPSEAGSGEDVVSAGRGGAGGSFVERLYRAAGAPAMSGTIPNAGAGGGANAEVVDFDEVFDSTNTALTIGGGWLAYRDIMTGQPPGWSPFGALGGIFSAIGTVRDISSIRENGYTPDNTTSLVNNVVGMAGAIPSPIQPFASLAAAAMAITTSGRQDSVELGWGDPVDDGVDILNSCVEEGNIACLPYAGAIATIGGAAQSLAAKGVSLLDTFGVIRSDSNTSRLATRNPAATLRAGLAGDDGPSSFMDRFYELTGMTPPEEACASFDSPPGVCPELPSGCHDAEKVAEITRTRTSPPDYDQMVSMPEAAPEAAHRGETPVVPPSMSALPTFYRW